MHVLNDSSCWKVYPALPLCALLLAPPCTGRSRLASVWYARPLTMPYTWTPIVETTITVGHKCGKNLLLLRQPHHTLWQTWFSHKVVVSPLTVTVTSTRSPIHSFRAPVIMAPQTTIHPVISWSFPHPPQESPYFPPIQTKNATFKS